MTHTTVQAWARPGLATCTTKPGAMRWYAPLAGPAAPGGGPGQCARARTSRGEDRYRQTKKGDQGWLTSTPCMPACSRPTRLATPAAPAAVAVADVWPTGHYGRRSGRAAGPVPGVCGRAAHQRQAADPTKSPDRRLRGACVAGRRATQGDVSADKEADRGGVGVAGHRGTTSSRGPTVRERSAPGFRCLPAAEIGRIPAITHEQAQRGSQVLAAAGQRLPASGGTHSVAASREPPS